LEQIQNLQERGISRQELDTAQSYLVGHLALEFETSEDLCGKILELIEDGMPLDYWSRYPDKVQALTTQEVGTAAKSYMDPDRDVVVLVGNIAGFKKDLKKLGRFRLIPLNQVDFGSADLTRSTQQ
ncbi:MAG TPA: hypothetical protein VMO17_22410, partial [Terriglobia bacterium]|nr:hypothetical protein [Terriglobia bacterium]